MKYAKFVDISKWVGKNGFLITNTRFDFQIFNKNTISNRITKYNKTIYQLYFNKNNNEIMAHTFYITYQN